MPDLEPIVDALEEHVRTNRDAAALLHQLIAAMREQHHDMQEQHADLDQQHRDNQAINRKLLWATVVMTLATVVMAFDAVSS